PNGNLPNRVFRPPNELQKLNTVDIPPPPPEARPPEAVTSSDFSRGFASGRAILAHQLLDPARGREPPRLVCLGQQPGDVAPQLARLMRGQVSRQFVQQADQLPDVGGS